MEEFVRLLAQHRNVLERFVRFRVGNSYDADDIIQETCLSAYRSFSMLKDTALFKPWILRIARNKCTDYFRRLAKTMEIPTDRLSEQHERYGSMGVTVETCVGETLHKLGDKDQQVLYLYYFRQWPQSEIAKYLGVPVGTVKSRLHTARVNFKARYPDQNLAKGGNEMKQLPDRLPEYKIIKSEQPPFSVRFEELMGWFIIPLG